MVWTHCYYYRNTISTTISEIFNLHRFWFTFTIQFEILQFSEIMTLIFNCTNFRNFLFINLINRLKKIKGFSTLVFILTLTFKTKNILIFRFYVFIFNGIGPFVRDSKFVNDSDFQLTAKKDQNDFRTIDWMKFLKP